MDLPMTESGNKHVVVFQDYFTKWPLVYPVPNQKAIRLVELLTKEVIPLFGVPKALLSDRGTNLLSHVMSDVCVRLGIVKLNTTAYHPTDFSLESGYLLNSHMRSLGSSVSSLDPGTVPTGS